MKKDVEQRILDLFSKERISVPDYSMIYHRTVHKVRKRISPWPFLIPVAVLLFFLALPQGGNQSYQFIDVSALSTYYDEGDLLSLENNLNNYGDPYAQLFELNNNQLRLVIDELKGATR